MHISHVDLSADCNKSDFAMISVYFSLCRVSAKYYIVLPSYILLVFPGLPSAVISVLSDVPHHHLRCSSMQPPIVT